MRSFSIYDMYRRNARLTEAPAKGGRDRSSLRHVMGLDGPDNICSFEEKIGAVFWILYGQTETSGLVSLSPAMECPGSAGRVRIIQCILISYQAWLHLTSKRSESPSSSSFSAPGYPVSESQLLN